MKRSIPFPSEEMSPFVIQYIELWREKKKYEARGYLSLGDVWELLIATTYTLYQDDSDGRFFNYSLQGEECAFQWDGDEPIDTMFYQVTQNIKKRLAAGRTFNSNSEEPQS